MISNVKTAPNKRKKMPSTELKKFKELLNIQASSKNEKMIYKYIVDWLDARNIPNETDAVGNIIATKGKVNEGEYYPCIVSHLDTVHEIKKDFKVLEATSSIDGNVLLYASSGGKTAGVGGDDKNGIYSCLFMLEKIDVIKVVFFAQEEVGCIGSGDIELSYFNDVGYIIQLDRWGNNDFISMYAGGQTISDGYFDKIADVLDEHKYLPNSGLITDSITLFNRGVGVSCVNISCGYYKHHSDEEYIDCNELMDSVLMTKKIIETLGNNIYKHIKAVKPPMVYNRHKDNYMQNRYPSDRYSTKRDIIEIPKRAKSISDYSGMCSGDPSCGLYEDGLCTSPSYCSHKYSWEDADDDDRDNTQLTLQLQEAELELKASANPVSDYINKWIDRASLMAILLDNRISLSDFLKTDIDERIVDIVETEYKLICNGDLFIY